MVAMPNGMITPARRLCAPALNRIGATAPIAAIAAAIQNAHITRWSRPMFEFTCGI